MKFKSILAATIMLALLPAVSTAAQKKRGDNIAQPANIDSVTVLAETSLLVPLSKINRVYSQSEVVDVNAVFNSAAELYRSIDQGDPADIIITSNVKLLKKMEQRGLVNMTTKVILAGNRLVVVTAKTLPIKTGATGAKDILNAVYNKTIMTIADTNDSALGNFTKEALISLELWKKFERRVIIGASASRTVDLIIKGPSAGIIYATDAKLYADKLDILAEIPEKMHSPVEYYAALVVGDNMHEAGEYLQFLASNKAKAVFKSLGFVVK